MQPTTRSRRVRVERGIYLQPNGKYAVCCRRAGKLGFRTMKLRQCEPPRPGERREDGVVLTAPQRGALAARRVSVLSLEMRLLSHESDLLTAGLCRCRQGLRDRKHGPQAVMVRLEQRSSAGVECELDG
jgi:hypothetical protein